MSRSSSMFGFDSSSFGITRFTKKFTVRQSIIYLDSNFEKKISFSFIDEALSWILMFTYGNENSKTTQNSRAKIFVSNRVSIFDNVALRKFFSDHQIEWVK